MADKLLIVLMNCDPSDAMEVAPALSQAAVAVAMEFEVELILTGKAGRLAVTGFAENVRLPGESSGTLYDSLQEACRGGVKLKMSATGVEYWGESLIPEVTEVVGDAYLISESMDNDTVTFTY